MWAPYWRFFDWLFLGSHYHHHHHCCQHSGESERKRGKQKHETLIKANIFSYIFWHHLTPSLLINFTMVIIFEWRRIKDEIIITVKISFLSWRIFHKFSLQFPGLSQRTFLLLTCSQYGYCCIKILKPNFTTTMIFFLNLFIFLSSRKKLLPFCEEGLLPLWNKQKKSIHEDGTERKWIHTTCRPIMKLLFMIMIL